MSLKKGGGGYRGFWVGGSIPDHFGRAVAATRTGLNPAYREGRGGGRLMGGLGVGSF